MAIAPLIAGILLLLLGRRIFWIYVGAVGFVVGFNVAKSYFPSGSDTLVLGSLYSDAQVLKWDGLISVANLPGEQWSFAKTNGRGEVEEVTEKVRISDHASTGQYYFRRGKDLVKFGLEMIEKKEKTRGEYYVIPVYRKMIEAGLTIGISEAKEMWDLGTPDAKLFFEKHYKPFSQSKG